MKKLELIKCLQSIDGDFEVTISDRKGKFSGIKNVEMQNWSDDKDSYASITIVLGDYDKSKLIISPEKFIDNINKELDDDSQIDKEEAIKAKQVFDDDYNNNIQETCRKWYEKNYKKIEDETLIELFDDNKSILEKTINELKYYIYKNDWVNEISPEDLNDKASLVGFLLTKLNDEVMKKINIKCIIA